MKLNPALINIISKQYEPCSLIKSYFRGKDIAFKTDEKGNAILLFVGKEDKNGIIKGERYLRTLKYEMDGSVMKDHWELKGKAT